MSKALGESKVALESFISGKDLVEGVVVEVLGAPVVIDQDPEKTPPTSDFYTGEGRGLVKADIINVGQTMRYKFLFNGEECFFDNASYVFYKTLYKLAPDLGQPFSIQREGDLTKTKYNMAFINAPEVAEAAPVVDGSEVLPKKA